MTDTTIWMIRINGYGTFEFEGSEQEAEDMRSHKARWERGVGIKWRKDLSRESDRLSSEIAEIWDTGKGVPEKLFRRLREVRVSEAQP